MEFSRAPLHRDLNSLNSNCTASLSGRFFFKKSLVTKKKKKKGFNLSATPEVMKREKYSRIPGSGVRPVFFLSAVRVALEGAGFVPALFTITILFVSRSRINECMRSCLFDDHNAWGILMVHRCSICVSWIIHHMHTHTHRRHRHCCMCVMCAVEGVLGHL